MWSRRIVLYAVSLNIIESKVWNKICFDVYCFRLTEIVVVRTKTYMGASLRARRRWDGHTDYHWELV